MEDSKIISLFFERSEQAIEELDRKHGPAVKRTSAKILKGRLDVEECVSSIHAPRVGRDRRWTVPASGFPAISIHAPRVGRDANICDCCRRVCDFNPRAPRGARRRRLRRILSYYQFQSTRPAWGATVGSIKSAVLHKHFNPRAPRGARPSHARSQAAPYRNFNPRAPRGARRCTSTHRCPSSHFNPRAPRGARQQNCPKLMQRFCSFLTKYTYSVTLLSKECDIYMLAASLFPVRSSRTFPDSSRFAPWFRSSAYLPGHTQLSRQSV